MLIFPAIDIIGGRVVRLTKGDYDTVKDYSITCKQAAAEFVAQGARHIHAVDLDGAKSGTAENAKAVCDIIGASGAFVEIGGGIRTENRIIEYLNAGAKRVILGTVAVRDPDFTAKMAEKYGASIAVGVDAADGKVAVSGWREVTDIDAYEFCRGLVGMGVRNIIFTDISRDGMLSGANIDAYKRLLEIDGIEITASGGVSSIDDIIALKNIGVHAAILGKALYENRLSLKDAIAAAR